MHITMQWIDDVSFYHLAAIAILMLLQPGPGPKQSNTAQSFLAGKNLLFGYVNLKNLDFILQKFTHFSNLVKCTLKLCQVLTCFQLLNNRKYKIMY